MTVAANITADVTNAVVGAGPTDPWVLATAFVGAVAGVTYRTILPYLELARQEEHAGREPLKFLGKYKFTMGISLLLSVVITMGGFEQLTRNLDETAALATIFIISFTSGIGWSEITNRVNYTVSEKIKGKEAPAATTTTTTTASGTTATKT